MLKKVFLGLVGLVIMLTACGCGNNTITYKVGQFTVTRNADVFISSQIYDEFCSSLNDIDCDDCKNVDIIDVDYFTDDHFNSYVCVTYDTSHSDGTHHSTHSVAYSEH